MKMYSMKYSYLAECRGLPWICMSCMIFRADAASCNIAWNSDSYCIFTSQIRRGLASATRSLMLLVTLTILSLSLFLCSPHIYLNTIYIITRYAFLDTYTTLITQQPHNSEHLTQKFKKCPLVLGNKWRYYFLICSRTYQLPIIILTKL